MSELTATWQEFVAITRAKGLCGFHWYSRGGGIYVCQERAGHACEHRDGGGFHPRRAPEEDNKS